IRVIALIAPVTEQLEFFGDPPSLALFQMSAKSAVIFGVISRIEAEPVPRVISGVAENPIIGSAQRAPKKGLAVLALVSLGIQEARDSDIQLPFKSHSSPAICGNRWLRGGIPKHRKAPLHTV